MRHFCLAMTALAAVACGAPDATPAADASSDGAGDTGAADAADATAKPDTVATEVDAAQADLDATQADLDAPQADLNAGDSATVDAGPDAVADADAGSPADATADTTADAAPADVQLEDTVAPDAFPIDTAPDPTTDTGSDAPPPGCCGAGVPCPNGGTCVEAQQNCKDPTELQAGQCWADANCPGAVCQGANVCPCGALCLVADKPGACVPSKGCKKLDPNSFGACEMILGWVWNGQKCVHASGCGCGAECANVYKEQATCVAQCQAKP